MFLGAGAARQGIGQQHASTDESGVAQQAAATAAALAALVVVVHFTRSASGQAHGALFGLTAQTLCVRGRLLLASHFYSDSCARSTVNCASRKSSTFWMAPSCVAMALRAALQRS